MAELPAEGQHGDHRSRAILLAMPRSQPVPQFVITGGPAAGLAPLRQRLRSGERTGLIAQNVQVMFKVEHMLTAAMAAFVASDQTASVPDLDMQGTDARFHP